MPAAAPSRNPTDSGARTAPLDSEGREIAGRFRPGWPCCSDYVNAQAPAMLAERSTAVAACDRRLRKPRVPHPLSDGGRRPPVDSQEPAKISSNPATAPAPGCSPRSATPKATATTGLTWVITLARLVLDSRISAV